MKSMTVLVTQVVAKSLMPRDLVNWLDVGANLGSNQEQKDYESIG